MFKTILVVSIAILVAWNVLQSIEIYLLTKATTLQMNLIKTILANDEGEKRK